MFLSHAADVDLENQDSKTNSENVQFSVYLDENDRSKNQTSKSIVAEDLKLFVAINVQGGGKLENTKIEFSNSNFELKDNSNTFEKNIGTISSENGISFGLPIVARKNSKYNLSLLNMVSTIKLTGEYIDKNGNVTKIDTTKNVKVEWTADEITQEEVELSQEVITNRLYNIEGTNKRIVQVLVKSNIVENKAPVKSTRIEIQEPEIGVKPEQVKVAAKNTLATNGKTNVEFGNLVDSKYEYKQEEGKTYIEILNKVDEENNISWQKNVSDEIIVTYIYNEETEINPFTSKVKSTIELYGRNEAIEKENELALENIETVGDINTLESTVTNNIYKGNMYIGEETSYETAWSVFVSYSKLTNKIMLQDISAEGTEQLSTYYKTTKINKAKAIDLLGEEGIIKVYNAEDLSTPIAEKKLSEETEEYITINYETNVKQIVIETTNAVKEGKLEILNEKSIKVLKAEGIEGISTLTTEVKLAILDETEKAVTTITKSAIANLVEPETTIELNLDKNEISNQTENAVRLTAVLKSVDNSNKLFKNPTINIEFPKEITEVTLENKSLLYDEELKIKTTEITTNESGNKLLKIELEGEQTKYNTSIAQGGANIVLDLKLKANNFMANKNVEIKTTCINGAENVTKTNNVDIVSKKGILNKSIIKNGDSIVEEVNKNEININLEENKEIEVSTMLINNYSNDLLEVAILGNIPNSAKFKSVISTDLNGSTVYYSEEENATINSQNWKTEIENLDSIKSFKIVSAEMKQGEKITVNYKYELAQAETEKNIITVSGMINNELKEEKITYVTEEIQNYNFKLQRVAGVVTDSEKLSVEVISTIGGQDASSITEINNGQVIRYKVKVTNKSSEDIKNINIKSTIENAVYYELAEDGGTFFDEETEEMVKSHRYKEIAGISTKEFDESVLKPNETKEVEYQVVAYIGNGENANKFKNSILITAENMSDLAIENNKTIIEAEIALKLHYSGNEEPELYSNGDLKIFEIELTNLTKNNLKNVPINIELNDKFSCNTENQMYFDTTQASINVENNKLNINVYELQPNETKKIYFQLETESIPLNQLNIEIMLIASAMYNGKTYLSNEYRRNMYQTETSLNLEFTSDKIGEILYLESEDTITYTLTITNTGILETGNLYIFDEVPYELNIINIIAQENNGNSKEYSTNEEGNICIDDLSLDSGEQLKVIITAKLETIIEENSEIINKILIRSSNVKEIVRELINIYKIELDIPEDSGEPEEPGDPIDPSEPSGTEEPSDPTDSENPEDLTEMYSISGMAWLDKNKNGIKDNNEEVMEGIEVILLGKDGNPVKNEQENVISTTTEVTGTYKFNNVPEGEYIVAFIYDSNKYTVTKYQVENAQEDENSDAISKQITIDNETILIGATDTIKVENEDLKNIDIGLIENAKFDLSLEKYVSKVVVTNSAESVNYNFGEETLAKVEIAAKRLAGSTVLLQYEIKVSNEGDIQGYVSDVIDYMPKELEFNSEMNPDWYLDTNGILHNKTLEKTAIEPGKTQTVSLVLTKTLNSNSTGIIENIAEIGTATNLEQIKDADSTPGNKVSGEDDIATASLIISIKTGSPAMYIGIVLASLTVIGLGIYIINKKILRNIG